MRCITAGSAIALLVASVLPACGGSQGSAPLNPLARSPLASPAAKGFKFKTVVNRQDSTFNRLLGINDKRTAVGYDGSGEGGRASAGYEVVPPFERHDFTAESFPGAAQTRVTAINNRGDTAGLWIDAAGAIHGFIAWEGIYASYDDPSAANDTEILGLNDSGVAAGFYTDVTGTRHGFTLDRDTGKFTDVSPPEASNVTAAGINDNGDVVGYYASGSQTFAFFETGGNFSEFGYPGAAATMALGVNARGTIVGGYRDGSGGAHGFVVRTLNHQPRWESIDHPKGAGTTTINGINDRLNLVGWYVNSAGNTVGMLIERKKT